MTKARRVYHVVPSGQGWDVIRVGGRRVTQGFSRKVAAIARAKELAMKGALGQVRVHRGDGQIQTEVTFGKDPRRTRG